MYCCASLVPKSISSAKRRFQRASTADAVAFNRVELRVPWYSLYCPFNYV